MLAPWQNSGICSLIIETLIKFKADLVLKTSSILSDNLEERFWKLKDAIWFWGQNDTEIFNILREACVNVFLLVFYRKRSLISYMCHSDYLCNCSTFVACPCMVKCRVSWELAMWPHLSNLFKKLKFSFIIKANASYKQMHKQMLYKQMLVE